MSAPIVRLGDVCEVVSGATPSRSVPEYWNGDIRWVTPKELAKLGGPRISETAEKITPAGFRSSSTRMLPIGAVLFSSRAPIGHTAIVATPMCTNQGFKSLVPSTGVVSEYLYWAMRWSTPRIEAAASGTTFKEVSKADIEAFEIPLPRVEEQRRIAAILDEADAIRRKRREALGLLDDLLRSTFLQMFGDLRNRVSPWPWGTCRTDVKMASGKSPKGIAASKPTEIPIYGGNGVNGFATEPLYLQPVIVVGRVGQYCGATHLTEGPCWVTDNAIVVEVESQRELHPVYLATCFQFASLRDVVSGLDLPFINQEMLRSLEIPRPPYDVQLEFVERRAAILAQRRLSDVGLLESETLFSSLLHRAFTGAL